MRHAASGKPHAINRIGGFHLQQDVLIIGAGVVGCALARELSRYDARICVADRAPDVAEGASKANSGIVHAGFDAHPGTLKARLNVRGAKMYRAVCEEVDAPYGQPGALVLGFTEEDRATLETLYRQGVENGVDGLSLIGRDDILLLEPNVSPDVLCALWAKTSGLTSPYELTCALADHAAVNGVEFHLNTEVESIEPAEGAEGGYVVHTNRGDIQARAVVNCAGVDSARLHNQLSENPLRIIPRKGEYYLMDRVQPPLFTMTLFQTPTLMGKGVLVTPTVHGNLLMGPTATDIEDGLDVSTTADALAFLRDKARLTWKNASTRGVITTFAGIRAHEENGDFVVGRVPGRPLCYETVGIESPGLTAAPAIAEMVRDMVAEDMRLEPKATFQPAPVRQKPFYAMTLEERAQAVRERPENGSLVCRCEQVTEYEIRAAIRRPVGATTIDGVKRRTRAGMGRCQGGFCSPRVLEILAEELHEPKTAITKCGGKSVVLVGTIAEAAEAARHGRKEDA